MTEATVELDLRKVNRVLDKAKIMLMQRSSCIFISTVLFNLKIQWNREIPTAGVDGINLYINPDFYLEATPGQRIFVLAHEAWHVCFQHILDKTSTNKDLMVWNMAGDHVINLMLKSEGHEMWDWVLADPKYVGWSTVEVYEDLMANPPPPQPQGDGNRQGDGEGYNMQDIIPSNDSGKENPNAPKEAKQAAPNSKELQEKVEQVIIQANSQRQLSKEAGNLPAEMEIAIEKLVNPKLPWNVILQNYVSELAKDDYSYRRPNRRFQPDYYLPSAYSETIPRIAIAIDASSSVSDDEFIQFLTEIQSIKDHYNPQQIDIITFNTRIVDTIVITADQSVMDYKFEGRGGTDVTEVMQWAEKNQPFLLIIFTDGHFGQYFKDPKCPVIWTINDNRNFKSTAVKTATVINYDT